MLFQWVVGSHVTLHSDEEQEVKTAMDDMKESSYCAGSHEVMRERYKQKIKAHVGCEPEVMRRSKEQTTFLLAVGSTTGAPRCSGMTFIWF